MIETRNITSDSSYERCLWSGWTLFVCPLGGSMILSGISCFFLWFGTSESMMIFMLCLYNGLSISAWNSLDVVTTESFPTVRRWGEHKTYSGVFIRWFSLVFVFWSPPFVPVCSPEELALGSAMLCVSWLQSWGTWSLALWLASPRPSPSSWHRRCSSEEDWWDSGCLTLGQTSSCNNGVAFYSWDKTWVNLPGSPGTVGLGVQIAWPAHILVTSH